MDEVEAVTDYNTVKTMGLEEAKKAGLYEVIGQEVDDGYIAKLKKQVIHQDSIDAVGKELKIVYSPLHGTGNIPAASPADPDLFRSVQSSLRIPV